MLEVSLSINGRSSKVNEHSPKATTIARYYIATRLTAAHWAKFAKKLPKCTYELFSWMLMDTYQGESNNDQCQNVTWYFALEYKNL